MELPKDPRALTLSPPESGVHRWTLEAAWECRRRHLGPLEAVAAIKAVESQLRPGRKFSPREVGDAVAAAYEAETTGVARQRGQRLVPAFVDRVKSEAIELDDLRSMSPWDRPELITAIMAVDLLFPGEPLLCMAKDTRSAYTARREHWLHREHALPFIVPSVAETALGKRKSDGLPSKRCEEMFPHRSYAVCEFDDHAPPAEQVGRALYLARVLPLVCVLHSGGKSVHAWYRAAGEAEEDVLAFYEVAIALGADRVGRTRCQLMRTPGAWRQLPDPFADGIRQRVHYFDHKEVAHG